MRRLVGDVVMHEEAGGKGRLFPVLPAASGEDGLASLLREDLLAAGVDRPELHHRAISTKVRLARSATPFCCGVYYKRLWAFAPL